jgi:hypothetical protein
MGFALLMLMSLASSAAMAPSSVEQASRQDPSTWTVMVYMAADSSVPIPWQDDINEMEAAAQMDGLNVILLLDILGGPDSRLLKVVHDPNGLEDTIVSVDIDDGGAVISGGEVNTGDPATLSAFVGFCSASYPADRLVLILWGHGAGWHGLCPDGSDFLTLAELRAALSDVHDAIGRPLDTVCVDACAQGSLEMLFQVAGHADYFVASQKDVPYEGLPYTLVLNGLALDLAQSPAEFSSRIVEVYHLWTSINSIYATTMAAYDMSMLGPLSEAMSTMFGLGNGYMGMFHDPMHDALSSAEFYEVQWYVDFGDMMAWMLRSDLPLELRHMALANMRAYSQLVAEFAVYSHQDPYDGVFANRSSGAVIYAASSEAFDAEYASLEIVETGWFSLAKMIRSSMSTSEGETGPSASYYDADEDGRADSLTLSWSAAHELHLVWAFRDIDQGLEFGQTMRSPGGDIALDLPGRWALSASAWAGGEAVSYSILNVTLYGSTEVRITIQGSDAEDFALTISSSRGIMTYDLSGSTGTFTLDVPEFAETGQIICVQARDSIDGGLKGEAKFFLGPGETSVAIYVHEVDESGPDMVVPITLAILPGALILAFAAILVLDDRKKARERA